MRLLIYGAGGVGAEICDIAERVNARSRRWDQIAFIDDVRQEGSHYGRSILRFSEIREDVGASECVIAQGEPEARMSLFEKVSAARLALTQLVDPGAVVSSTATLGAGCIIFPGAFISSNVELAENSMIQIGTIVGHDNVVGPHTVVSSGTVLGGRARIGARTFVGMGSIVKEEVTIGSGCIVGMGSVVFADVADELIALGHPARPMRRNVERKVFGKG